MSDFKLLDPITESERFTTDKGEFVVYTVACDGPQGRSEAILHKRKASSPAPKAGEVVDAEIVHGRNGAELKRIYKQGGASNGGGGGGKSYGKSPQELAEMRRMSAQKQCLAYLDIKQRMGKLEQMVWSDFVKLVDRFEDDIKNAGQRA